MENSTKMQVKRCKNAQIFLDKICAIDPSPQFYCVNVGAHAPCTTALNQGGFQNDCHESDNFTNGAVFNKKKLAENSQYY